MKVCGKTLRRAKIAVLGISGEPDVKAPVNTSKRHFIELLMKKVRNVQIYDPFFLKKEINNLGFEADVFSKVIDACDCILILVGHSKWSRLNLKRLKMLVKNPAAIVDTCFILDPRNVEEVGFVYRGLGRGVWKI